MARKILPLEAQLDRLAELRSQPPSPEAGAEVAGYLKSKINLPAAKAARIAGEWQATELMPELVAAFERFLVKPETTDKRCAAKIEILKALLKLEYASPSLFRRGLRFVQMEPSWGAMVDTAAEVRALCAMGLAQTDYPDALEEIVPLLVDPERDARIGAVRAIAASGRPGDTLLLRLKAFGADEAEVMGECFAALLRAAPEKSVDFVAQFLDRPAEEIAEAAALALGDSRIESAFDVLREAFLRKHTRSLGRSLLLGMALLRRESAIDYLLDLVRSAEDQTATDATDALAMYQEDPGLTERLKQARRARASAAQ